jgi:hypothetical protein
MEQFVQAAREQVARWWGVPSRAGEWLAAGSESRDRL